MSGIHFGEQPAVERVVVGPADIANLEILAAINQGLADERAAGLHKFLETTEVSNDLADVIRQRTSGIGEGMGRGQAQAIELEMDPIQKKTLDASRRLGGAALI